LAVSELAYRSTIKRTEGTTQLWASSNYCAQLLRHKKFDEAVKVMQNVEPTLNDTSLNPIAKSRALYNLGKSLQMSGQHKQAYDVLKRSMDADPTFRKAAVAAGQSALKADRETTGIPQVLELTDSQLKHFGYGGAANNLRQALQVPRWQRSHLYPRLMRQLVRYFTITQVSPETFKKDWSEFLQLLYKNLASDHLCRQMVHQIRMVYSDTDSQLSNMDLIPRRIQRFYNVWRKALDRPGDNSEIAFLSEFIKMVGDHYYRQRDPNSLSKCMTRYSHAWGLDAHNIDAGIYLADTLLYARKNKDLELDPEGEILRGYIFLLFAIKGEEYQRELGKDWDKIMKCHVILAKIFEELKQWWGPDHNAETARFQWTAAQRALNMPGVSPEDREWFGPAIIKGIEEAERHRN
jgi:tetratricopeptide (TPR) repeat protein